VCICGCGGDLDDVTTSKLRCLSALGIDPADLAPDVARVCFYPIGRPSRLNFVMYTDLFGLPLTYFVTLTTDLHPYSGERFLPRDAAFL
jgi:hypothetical protein